MYSLLHPSLLKIFYFFSHLLLCVCGVSSFSISQLSPYLLTSSSKFNISHVSLLLAYNIGTIIKLLTSYIKWRSWCISVLNRRALKVIDRNDLKPSLVSGEGKRARLLDTMGVTRGFGDYDIECIYYPGLKIKPFLLPDPEVYSWCIYFITYLFAIPWTITDNLCFWRSHSV